ncbi:MAG: hypothetical protein QXM27_01845 [Candidatus Pacearchaeota archaeon]
MEKDVKFIGISIKDEIINFIKINGPSLASEIAKRINKPTYITSAILSEMVDNNLIRSTNIKIGSSPIYFLDSQLPQLERFQEYLNEKEKEVLDILKKNKILYNEKIDIETRLILNKLKDFAIPLKIKINDEEIIIWKYFLVENSEIENIISKLEKPERKEIEEIKEIKEKEMQKKLEVKIKKKIKREKRKKSNEEFVSYIEKNFENIEKISEEIYIGIKNIIDNEIKFLLIIKNKKRIDDVDILRCLREVEERKMPAILLTKAKITKKAKELIDKSGSLLIIKNL